MAKNQANDKQHPEAELLLFENYSHSSSTLSSKNNRTYPENQQKNNYILIHEIIRLIIMKMKIKDGSHRYDINRPTVPDKIEKFSKIGKDKKSLILTFAFF